MQMQRRPERFVSAAVRSRRNAAFPEEKDMKLSGYRPANEFDQLSLRDLLDAREQYHVFLMQHPNVVATAIGRYRIRIGDSWPSAKGTGKVHGKYPRTLENSEVRPYSWPCILVFVDEWVEPSALASTPGALVPKTLYLTDGRSVPVCIIEAPKEEKTEIEAQDIRFPLNNIGGGSPVIADVQGQQYAATIACLVSDGHKVYALTNRHVAGDAGEVVYSRLGGNLERIGVSSAKQLTREAFTTLYPGWPGRDVYVNLDVGLIEFDNIDQSTADIRGIGQMGKMVDLSVNNISLSLIGCRVRGVGAASGDMFGEVEALFYRYKTNGGFEYVADLMIGPRAATQSRGKAPPFATHPGDSGALWLLEPVQEPKAPVTSKKTADTGDMEYLPLAMQWGRNMLFSGRSAKPQSYVLATFLSRVCAELGVDPVRNWNVDQPDTWGAIGHFSIAARTQNALSNRFPKLVKLMDNNAEIISHDAETILTNDFKGMGKDAFVPMADVPDFFWKTRIAKQGFARPFEGPNHFADMDQPGPDGKTLLDLCKDANFVDPAKWDAFYDTVADLLTDEPITANHRGLLPFRVWQIFDAMIEFVGDGKAPQFVCAAGVLTHYLGDACQPLHISFLHDGDPLRKVEHTFQKGKHAGETEERPLGQGVHSAYEDAMVNAHRKDILDALKATPKVTKAELIDNGFEAAKRTIEMMRTTFNLLPPPEIVEAFIAFKGKPKDRSEFLWKKFGKRTIKSMQGGAHLLAVIWESAWALGDGEDNIASTAALKKAAAMKICADPDFVPSLTVDRIGATLKQPEA
jgi:hypothetical protein